MIITAEDIYDFYVTGEWRYGKVSSPFRSDSSPSFSIYRNSTNKLVWRDFGTNEYGGPLDLVIKIFGLDFKDALNKIQTDLNGVYTTDRSSVLPNGAFHAMVGSTSGLEPSKKKKKEVTVELQEFTKIDEKYWGSYGLSIDTVKKYNVRSVRTVFVGNKPVFGYTEHSPIYAYYVTDPGYDEYWSNVKVYRPFAVDYKWLGNMNNKVVFNIRRLHKGCYDVTNETIDLNILNSLDTIIITKSLKDVMVIESFNIPAIAPQSESYVDSNIVLRALDLYKNVYVLMDNDLQGEKISEKYVELGCKKLSIPVGYDRTKDISDLMRYHGKSEVTKIIGKNARK